MNILMPGWEFPPYMKSGGLGTACHGLTKGLSQLGAQETFVLPRPVPSTVTTPVRLVSGPSGLKGASAGAAAAAVPALRDRTGRRPATLARPQAVPWPAARAVPVPGCRPLAPEQCSPPFARPAAGKLRSLRRRSGWGVMGSGGRFRAKRMVRLTRSRR